MTVMTSDRALSDANLEHLREAGNPFRNFFARNPDDDVCAAITCRSCLPRNATSSSASSICFVPIRACTRR